MGSLESNIKKIDNCLERRDLFGANRLADQLLEDHVSDVRILNLAARVKMLSDRMKEAKRLAEKACIKHNCNIEAQYILGFCHQRLGEHKEAAEAYLNIIKKAPSSAFAHFKLGESLNMNGRREESLRAYQRAAELDDDGDIAALAEGEIFRLKEED